MAQTHHFRAQTLFSVQNYVCLITGGGTGIGLMAAQALAANGAKVYITGRRLEALQTAAKSHSPSSDGDGNGGQIIPLGPCDVTQKSSLENLVRELEARESHLNILMCNAGIPSTKAHPSPNSASDLKHRLWTTETVEDWQKTYSVDVTAVYFTTIAFLPLLQASLSSSSSSSSPQKSQLSTSHYGGPATMPPFGPSVITTSSMSGLIRHSQAHFAYNTAKASTAHLTKLMSAEFQKLGIRVNSIAPGYFPSEMTDDGGSDERQKSELPAEKVEEKGHVPLQRAGREEEMGMTVLFLARCEYVNGQVVAVDGGVMNVVGS